jgi:hypothetical protein
MGTLFTLAIAAAPILGGAGYFCDLPALFWTGVVLTVLNLTLNGMLGDREFPVFPLLLGIGVAWFFIWVFGGSAAPFVVLLMAIHALGEIFFARAERASA